MLDRTPVLDLKPYNERDTIFSPRGPRFLPTDREGRRSRLERMALTQHGEACPWLLRAVEIALAAEARLGPLEDDDVVLRVAGPGLPGRCVAGDHPGPVRQPRPAGLHAGGGGSGAPVEVEFRRGETTVALRRRSRGDGRLVPAAGSL